MRLVEKHIRDDRLTYIESILQICDDRQIDPLDIGKLIDKPLKQKIEAEAMRSNLLKEKGGNTLTEFL